MTHIKDFDHLDVYKSYMQVNFSVGGRGHPQMTFQTWGIHKCLKQNAMQNFLIGIKQAYDRPLML